MVKLPVELLLYPEMNDVILDKLDELDKKSYFKSPLSRKLALGYIADVYSLNKRAFTQDEADMAFAVIEEKFYTRLDINGFKFRNNLINIITEHDNNKRLLEKQNAVYTNLCDRVTKHNADKVKTIVQNGVESLDKIKSNYDRMIIITNTVSETYPCMAELCDWALDTLNEDYSLIKRNRGLLEKLYSEMLQKGLIEVN
ncbi:hypothetical protein D6777_03915 [Candidatus Woesearchaeota archaeon]|nr:MAG: hypothetical protein D6777_03915 [Candidatus Woesearchaeota archaeon]